MSNIPGPDHRWRVHVLCAQWCGVCRQYQPFVQSRAGQDDVQWVWVDIETHADLLGDLEVDNFPTLLVTEGDALRFMGPVTPQPEVALRLIQSLGEGQRGALSSPGLSADVLQALRTLAPV